MAHQSINLPAVKFGYVDEENPYVHYPVVEGERYYIGGRSSTYNRKIIYIGFEKCPPEIAGCKVTGAQITLRANDFYPPRSNGNWSAAISVYCYEDFDAENLTFSTSPQWIHVPTSDSSDYSHFRTTFSHRSDGDKYQQTIPALEDNSHYKSIGLYLARCSAQITLTTTDSNERLGMCTTLEDGTLPYLTIHYDDQVIYSSSIYYKSGPYGNSYADPRGEISFSWQYKAPSTAYCIKETWEQKSATFYWKESGAEEWNSIPVNDTKLTVQANTFPIGTSVVWYVEGTDDTDTTTSTAEYTFSTADSTAYATPVSPVDTAVDGSKDITFEWTLSNASGSTPTLVNFWWKLPTEANNQWHIIKDFTEPVTSYTVPANFFPSGKIEWLVRASNKDGTAGPSGRASFVCVAAPDVPVGVACDGKPFATFTWQSEEQQAYRIVINGTEAVKAFGTAKSYTLDEPLNDGEYTAEIYVQGVYGLWSSAGVVDFTVKNAAGAAVTLTGAFDVDAELSWTTEDETHNFYVYRDGNRIGKTDQLACADRLTLGEHGYFVLNRLPDNSYTRSNTVAGTTTSEETRIRRLGAGDDWTVLKLSSASASQQVYQYERQSTARHITGSRFPLLELSAYEDEAVSLDVAFTERIDMRIFEALKGQVVVIKCRGDNVIVGPMVSLQKVVGDFYTSYSFAIQRVDYEDVIDVQND